VPEKKPSTEEWEKLYGLMGKIKELSPWDYLEEQDVFALEDPQTGEIGFVSVMGAAGEHYSVTIYRGEDGLRRFLDFRDNYLEDDDLVFQKLIEIPQLQASFEDRDYLCDEDRKILKKLGLTFRGKSAWPQFRKYEPGFVPWFINAAEAQFLINALEQTIDVALRVKDESCILHPDDRSGYLLRRRTPEQSGALWQDFIWHETKRAPERTGFFSDMTAFERIRHLPRKEISIEMDLFMTPHAVREKGKKPYYPYILMLLETEKGMIIGHDLIPPLPDLSALWRKMPSTIARKLVNLSFLPAQVYVSSEKLYQSLMYLNDYTTLKVTYVKELLKLPAVRKSLLDHGFK
jgi:hypothetical protein